MWHFLVNIIFLVLLVRSSLEQTAECGVRKIQASEEISAENGTYPGQFPWHAAIFHRKSDQGDFEYACGGNLISSTFVLTTNRCMRDGDGDALNTTQMLVYLGIDNVVDFGSNYQKHSINRTYTVPRMERWENLANDIALLELNARVEFTDYIQPICLNTVEVSSEEKGVVVGWRRSEEGVLSETLEMANISIIDREDCYESDIVEEELEDGLFCSRYQTETDPEYFDGGLIVERCLESRCSWTLVGVTENNVTDQVNNDSFGVFTDVQMYLPWIKNVTNITFEEAVIVKESVCGQRQNDSLRSRWPWHGTLYRIDSQPLVDTEPITEGFGVSILTDQFVITAALVYRTVVHAPEEYRLRFGSPGNGLSNEYTQTMAIEATYIESINTTNATAYEDLAMFKLKGRLTFSKYVQPICLWNEQVSDIPNLFIKLVSFFVQPQTDVSIDLNEMTYFLSQNRSKPDANPAEIRMQILPSVYCENEKLLPAHYDEHFLCAQTRQTDSERGPQFWDIGTGLVMQKDDKWYLRGIYSDGYKGKFELSLKDNHTLFLNVQSFYNAIIHKIDTFSVKYD